MGTLRTVAVLRLFLGYAVVETIRTSYVVSKEFHNYQVSSRVGDGGTLSNAFKKSRITA